VLREKFIAMNAYNKNTQIFQTNDLMLHLKPQEKQEQVNSKTSRKEIIKIKAKINKTDTKKITYKESTKKKNLVL
jgi:hypothetical protein